MRRTLRTLLVVSLFIAVVGLLVKGLFWLFIVGALLMVGTWMYGISRP